MNLMFTKLDLESNSCNRFWTKNYQFDAKEDPCLNINHLKGKRSFE